MKTTHIRVFVVVFFVAALSLPAVSQSDTPKQFEVGVKGGLALPAFFWTGDDYWNPVTMFAFQGAAYGYACLNFSSSFALQVEAGYKGKGCNVDASDGHARWYMDYIEVPLWAKWSMREGANSNFYGGLGAYAAYFLGGRYDFSTGEPGLDGSGTLVRGTEETPTTVRPLDFGIVLICGMEAQRYIFEIRMPIGVVRSMQFTPPPVFGGPRGTLNSGIDLLVGYRF
jgi:hypothetical protein